MNTLQSEGKTRLISLDAMRGFTIAAMILVNFPGDEHNVFAPLKHTVWNGLTPTDLIAPFFLFIVGISIVLAYSKRTADPDQELYKKIVLRVLRSSQWEYSLTCFLILISQSSDIRGTLPRIAIVFCSVHCCISIHLLCNRCGPALSY